MGKRKEDLEYMSARLLLFEQWLAALIAMQAKFPKFKDDFEPAKEVVAREIENIEWCLKRDRINHQKPE